MRYSVAHPASLSSQRVQALLPPGTSSAKRTTTRFAIEHLRNGYVVRADGEVSAPMPLEDACEQLEGAIALHVAAHAPRHVFIHAGVVVWNGRALVLPGRSMAGKSTLVRFLVRNGAHYYSDEYAVLNRAGHVLPYARRLTLRRALGGRRKLALRAPRQVARRIAWVVGARYDARKRSFALEPISVGQTALLLLDNAVAARLSPARVMKAVRAVASGAVGLVGTRGEAERASRQLLAHCKGRQRVLTQVTVSRRS